MKSRVRILRNATLILLGSAVVAACSDSGTVTTLPARPKVDIGLPQELLNASAVVKTNLRPEIRFDNGSAVTLTRGEGNNWSGTINVTPGRTYQTTLTWLERVNQRDIALARLTQTLDVSADGTITGSQSSGYTTDIDTDNDGRSNLQERQDGTDPLIPGNGTDTGTGTDSGTGTGTDTGTDAGTDTGTDSGTDTGTGTGTDTGTGSGTDSGTGSGTDTGTDSGTDTGADSGTDTGADSGTDTGTDSGTDTGTDTGTDSGTDSGTDTGTDSGTDTGTDTGTDSGTDTGTDSGTGSGTDTGTDTNPPPVIADVIVPRIASSDAPVIDGKGLESLGSNGELIGEWAAAVQTDNSGAPLLIDQLIINNSTNESTGSDRRRWAAMHDGTYLYVLVLVDDDGDRNRDSGNNINQDDSLELFLDGDNSKSSRYDINDFSRLFPLQLPGADKQPTSSGAVAGVQSSSAPLSITFTTGPGIGPDGTVRRQYEQDVYELRIGLSSAGIDPDSPFGFELHVNDDDGGGNRNARWAWKLRAGSADIANQSPSVFGTLMLD